MGQAWKVHLNNISLSSSSSLVSLLLMSLSFCCNCSTCYINLGTHEAFSHKQCVIGSQAAEIQPKCMLSFLPKSIRVFWLVLSVF